MSKKLRIRPMFAWYDFWVGAFWDRKTRVLYLFPLPMFGVRISFMIDDENAGYDCLGIEDVPEIPTSAGTKQIMNCAEVMATTIKRMDDAYADVRAIVVNESVLNSTCSDMVSRRAKFNEAINAVFEARNTFRDINRRPK